MTKPRSRHVTEFDGLRGLLAIWVVVSHILSWCGIADMNLPYGLNAGWKAFTNPNAAVKTFVILSGFAISFLLNKHKNSYKDFMIGRFFRIYPVYTLCLILGFASSLGSPLILATASWRNVHYFGIMRVISDQEQARPFAHFLSHLTLLNGVVPRKILPEATGTLLAPAWSITLEWQYYLVAPLIAWLVRSKIGLLLLAIPIWFGLSYSDSWVNPVLAFLPSYLSLFLIGLGSYHFYARAVRGSEHPPSYSTYPSAILLLIALTSKEHAVALAIWAIAFGSVFACGDDLYSKLLKLAQRVLNHPWLQKLGIISYPIYLVHWPIIIMLLYALIRISPAITSIMAVIAVTCVGLPIILIAAELLHRYVEVQGMAYGKRLIGRPKEEAT